MCVVVVVVIQLWRACVIRAVRCGRRVLARALCLGRRRVACAACGASVVCVVVVCAGCSVWLGTRRVLCGGSSGDAGLVCAYLCLTRGVLDRVVVCVVCGGGGSVWLCGGRGAEVRGRVVGVAVV